MPLLYGYSQFAMRLLLLMIAFVEALTSADL